jgi:hypothetical protein
MPWPGNNAREDGLYHEERSRPLAATNANHGWTRMDTGFESLSVSKIPHNQTQSVFICGSPQSLVSERVAHQS